MTRGPRALKILIYSVWSVLLTATTYFLGAVPLKVLRVLLGRGAYWALGTMVSAAFWFGQNRSMAVAFLSMVLLIGIFEELEDVGYGFRASALGTLTINALLALGGFALWVYASGAKWHARLIQAIEDVQRPLLVHMPGLKVSAQDMLEILPSVVIVLWVCALVSALVFERRLLRVERPKRAPVRLRDFHVPDAVVWLFIAALLGRFGQFGEAYPLIGVVASNALNVCMVLLFFQGLAVIAKFFESLRMPWPWQLVFMALLIYLSLLISILGLMDYWLDFRARLTKRATSV